MSSYSSPLALTGRAIVVWMAVGFAGVITGAACLYAPDGRHFATGILWVVGCFMPTFLSVILHRRLRLTQTAHGVAVKAIATRSRTVDRILEFSQTIQAAGKPEQIFDSLSLFLHQEFTLSGVAILTHEPDALPATSLKSIYPPALAQANCSVADMDTGLCPCFRQNLPRIFKPDHSPVRCSIDDALRLPADHPAYCIPFTIGRKVQCTVHMLLPPGSTWTEELRQLAQTYVNTASSSLITLHHLAEAEKQSLTDGLTGLYNRRSMD